MRTILSNAITPSLIHACGFAYQDVPNYTVVRLTFCLQI
jgi:hypothetical protein